MSVVNNRQMRHRTFQPHNNSFQSRNSGKNIAKRPGFTGYFCRHCQIRFDEANVNVNKMRDCARGSSSKRRRSARQCINFAVTLVCVFRIWGAKKESNIAVGLEGHRRLSGDRERYLSFYRFLFSTSKLRS